MHRDTSSRRRFLKALATGSAVAGAACLGVGCGGGGLSGPVDAGNVKDLPVGTLRAIAGEPVAIARDDKGVYAMSTICTHASCDMESNGTISSAGMTCSCHGSAFDTNGNPTKGPAQSPLDHYAVTIDASGNITIETDTVDASTRTAAS